ncbi:MULTISPECIES: SpvB/TcaC N-terminal domain-containing protein [Burkholderiaceae]|uniref:SpvB/TcaC N-terminal domain-containing protein n=1 Tax=Burkholderiaceae TaxID=119060 RepID=UPI000962C1E6|nr:MULTISPECIES: SpvB/TcaC N-terminal domain-containing protein [Burkholderiaceae]MCG1041029.1 toxin [Mycetohabitans sp. B7]SIT64840.1 Insecticide toxin TcdB middle/C-terminal region [Burkholderia sp. b14]
MHRLSSGELTLTPPSLPKGGGAIQGLGESLNLGDPSGTASLTLPLPISAGRGYAPALTLAYSSGNGNGPFGVGWDAGLSAIRRRTSRGVPQYDDTDMFIGPDGEVLEPERDASGVVQTTPRSTFRGKVLNATFNVTRYYPRIEGAFNRIERWQCQGADDFWLIHGADGQLHCLGKNAQARIADATEPDERIAEWLIEESLSPTGEHICYVYQSAQSAGIVDNDGRDTESNRYLTQVHYGNQTAYDGLYTWADLYRNEEDQPKDSINWLFTLAFDYGQRGIDARIPPLFDDKSQPWPLRPDPFSHYRYGFEVRTHYLCRQILMFHHFESELDEPNTLVSRLLLEYDETPIMSCLQAAQRLAYEPQTSALQELPPLELGYTAFAPLPAAPAWQAWPVPEGPDQSPYQLVDLYGEGLPGILYRVGTDWRYRPPVRDAQKPKQPDAVTYDAWQSLPQVPALQGQHATLIDINGDGRLEWLVTSPGGPFGYYTLGADRNWSAFIPLTQWPIEYLHPQATLADLHGAGLPDLAMIGPKSVRLYINQRTGFSTACTTPQDHAVSLPIRGRDATELVAFSDVLGSGQGHLVSVRHDQLTCWPNLGNGRFGAPLTLRSSQLFDAEQMFDPRRVFLVDVDGSGAADLVYAQPNCLRLFFNESGNRFAEPIELKWPNGVHYDDLSQLSFADVTGQGTISVILSQLYSGPDLAPQHWRYDFAPAKPYLLNAVDNNRGAQTTFEYRSSAQEWLDEKREQENAVPGLPFPVQVVSRIIHTDAITGNQLTQCHRYRKGVYDGQEREFRGFGYVESVDSAPASAAHGNDDVQPPPLQTRSWYYTGQQDDEKRLYGVPYEDTAAFPMRTPWLTRFDGCQDVGPAPSAESTWWLYRALKGHLLRQEVYGLGQAGHAITPYSVSISRYQVREQQSAPTSGQSSAAPVALPLALEHTTYTYERIATDPVVSQSVQLQYDAYGYPTCSVTIQYPRRLQSIDSNNNPYADTALPSISLNSIFDPQQQVLRLQEHRSAYLHQDKPDTWRIGLPHQARQNALAFSSAQVPPGGLYRENLGTLLGADQPRVLIGQNVVHYTPGLPDIVKLVAYYETAVLDQDCVRAYANSQFGETIETLLQGQGGYCKGQYVLSVPGQDEARTAPLWVSQHSLTTYTPPAQFYRPVTQQSTKLTGVTTYTYDWYNCCLIQTKDALQNEVQAEYDYRFLVPKSIIDINNNVHEAQFDALGRVIGSTFYGEELGEPDGSQPTKVGFESVSKAPVSAGWTVSEAIATALKKEAQQSKGAGEPAQLLAAISLYDALSWMGNACELSINGQKIKETNLWQMLIALRFITVSGAVRARGWQWAESDDAVDGLPEDLRRALKALPRWATHGATLTADTYSPIKSQPKVKQQIHIAVAYTDGFGRALQTATRVPAGDAWQRTADGELAVGTNPRTPVCAPANPRWSVTGRIEYNNKGQPMRVYQPYFINDWHYVADRALRAGGYADTHCYDALGREVWVVTAKGYERRNHYFPWFTIAEDENDTGVLPAPEEELRDA